MKNKKITKTGYFLWNAIRSATITFVPSIAVCLVLLVLLDGNHFSIQTVYDAVVSGLGITVGKFATQGLQHLINVKATI